MLIIIEGADKTGKTTLAKAIEKRFGYRYHHSGPPKGHPADEYIDFLLNLKRPTVCDRFHLGELVYGPMFRGKAGISPLELLTIERVLRLKQTILIHAVTDISLANKRLHVSTQKEMVDDTKNQVAATLFNDVVRQSNLNTILRYDGSSKKNLDAMLELIDMVMPQRIDRQASYTGIGTVSGPKLVFVGEQVNKNVTWRGLPFDKGLSSEFLAETFEIAGLKESRIYICNADKVTPDELTKLGVYRGSAKVIALGKIADKKLTSLGIQHKALPHPQWVKRFHYKKQHVYAQSMRDACI